jgi:hypothetical protein
MRSDGIIISESMLPRLAQTAGSEVNIISPWARNYSNLKTGAGENLGEAEEQLYVAPGQLRPDLAETVELLKQPTKYVRLRLNKGPLKLEHIIYSCSAPASDDLLQVSLTLGEGKLTLRNPAPLDLIMVGLIEYLGDSSITSSSFRFKLKRADALCLAVLTDLHRRGIMADRAAMRNASPGHYSLHQIAEALLQTPPDNQWLTAAFSAYMQWKPALSEQELRAALLNLEGSALVADEDGKYSLTGEALSFASHFLLVWQALQLEAGMETKAGKVIRSNMLCLQGGLHDNLYLEADGEFITGESVSGHYLATLLDRFLAGDFTLQEAEPQQEQEPELAKNAHDTAKESRVYHIGRGEKSYGPYTWSEMVSFAAKGNLAREDLVWRPEEQQWVRADQLDDLFN